MLKYAGMFVIVVICLILFIAVSYISAIIFKRFGKTIFPGSYTKDLCPNCNSARVELSKVGIIWKLYWFYPIILFPLVIGLFAIFNSESNAILSNIYTYFFSFYILLFLGRHLGIVGAIIGTLDYECPSCGEQYAYVNKILHFRTDDPEVDNQEKIKRKLTHLDKQIEENAPELKKEAMTKPAVRYAINTYKAHRSGMFKKVTNEIEKTSVDVPPKDYLESYLTIYQLIMEKFADKYPPDDDEFIVDADAEVFLLTNKRLIFDYPEVLTRIIPLSEISDFQISGGKKQAMKIELKSGETVELETDDSVPKEARMKMVLNK